MTLQFKFKMQTVFEHWRCPHVIVAESEKDAKYEYYRTFNRGFFEMEFQEFVKYIECNNLGIADIKQFFGNEERFRRMCKKRRITFAYLGMRVQILGRMGTIVGNYKNDLYVLFDGDTLPYSCNPMFEIAYFDKDRRVIKDTRKGVYAV